MYIRSHDSLGQRELSLNYGATGLSDGLEKGAGISPELVYKLADLVFFSRYPKRMGKEIKGNRSLEFEYNKIYKQLLNPSSVDLPTGFEINLNTPDIPKPDYSKTEDELSAWELAKFYSHLNIQFSTEKIVQAGKLGSFVSLLSIKFDKPQFTIFIAKHLLDKSYDPKKKTGDKNWTQIRYLVEKHAYVHLKIYCQVIGNMEKMLQELFGRLLLLPTGKNPLGVSQMELDEYMQNLVEFLNAIVKREFWKKTCEWDRQDYPVLFNKMSKLPGVFMPMGLNLNCGYEPILPNIPILPIPIKSK